MQCCWHIDIEIQLYVSWWSAIWLNTMFPDKRINGRRWLCFSFIYQLFENFSLNLLPNLLWYATFVRTVILVESLVLDIICGINLMPGKFNFVGWAFVWFPFMSSPYELLWWRAVILVIVLLNDSGSSLIVNIRHLFSNIGLILKI